MLSWFCDMVCVHSGFIYSIVIILLRKFCSFDSLSCSQQFFSHVGTGLPGLNQAADKVSCSRESWLLYCSCF